MVYKYKITPENEHLAHLRHSPKNVHCIMQNKLTHTISQYMCQMQISFIELQACHIQGIYAIKW